MVKKTDRKDQPIAPKLAGEAKKSCINKRPKKTIDVEKKPSKATFVCVTKASSKVCFPVLTDFLFPFVSEKVTDYFIEGNGLYPPGRMMPRIGQTRLVSSFISVAEGK